MNSLLREEVLRGIIDGEHYYFVDKVLSFVAAYIRKRPGVVEKCDLSRLSVLYSRMMNKVRLDHRGGA